jgi:hypothetical protein
MTLPTPPDRYDRSIESERNRVLELADIHNLKRNSDIDIPLPTRVFMRSPNGSRWQISVSNAGALVVTSA